MSIKKLAFAALAVLSITLGTLTIGGSAQAARHYYGDANTPMEGGNG
jgi:hypothetical protein